MAGLQLRDEAVRDRIRLAEEFLDPSECSLLNNLLKYLLTMSDDARARRLLLKYKMILED